MGRSSRARSTKRKAARQAARNIAAAAEAEAEAEAESTTNAKAKATTKTKTKPKPKAKPKPKPKAKTAKKLTTTQKKKIELAKVQAKVRKMQLSAGGRGRMGALATKTETGDTNSKGLRQTQAGKKHKSTLVLEKAKKDYPDLNSTSTRMHNAPFKKIAANKNADVAALVLRLRLFTVAGVDDSTLDSIAKEWINAHYDKKAAKEMAKMPRIWILHKLGVAIDNYKTFYSVKAWDDLAE